MTTTATIQPTSSHACGNCDTSPGREFADLVYAIETDAPAYYVQEALARLRQLGYEVKLLPESDDVPGRRAGGRR